MMSLRSRRGLVLTSDEVLSLEHLPSSVTVIGGGAIGCEFASMFADLGSKVTILEALPTLLPGCDEDVVKQLSRAFSKRGIDIHTGVLSRVLPEGAEPVD